MAQTTRLASFGPFVTWQPGTNDELRALLRA